VHYVKERKKKLNVNIICKIRESSVPAADFFVSGVLTFQIRSDHKHNI